MPEQIPVLLDTDIGNDIDDALALAYLLNQPRCELVGITTVTGDVGKRAALAEVLCRAAGREDVPIVAGRSEVLVYGPGQPDVHHYPAIDHFPHRQYTPDQAVDFLRAKIRECPGEIVLVTVGPLTNAALLFALDPEIPSLLKNVLVMGGAFFGFAEHEWNCHVDPIATAMFAKAKPTSRTWFGLDVTMKLRQTQDDARRAFRGPVLEAVLRMAEIWFQGAGDLLYHDPLATACVFEPALCEYAKGTVTIDPTDGRTTFAEGEGGETVATQVDVERFFGHYFEIAAKVA